MPPIIKAAFWMGGALMSFITLAVAGRELSSDYGTFQILFYRGVIGLVIVLFFLWRSGFAQIYPKHLGIQILRNSFHFAGQAAWFYGIAVISLAEVFAIEFTTPIWTALLASLLLGEKLTWTRIFAIAMGFIGILIILRPGLVSMTTPALIVLAGAVGFAVTATLTKKLSGDTTALAILFYMAVIQLPMAMIPSVIDWQPPTWQAMPWFIAVGITALSAHFCIVKAFQNADATVVVPMDFLRVPLIAVVGFLLYAEAFDPWVLVGAVIIFSGNLTNLLAEQRKQA
ncbi:DMT family transporter [Sneathiella sp. CAU 1612]|jgi:drug/metabolite transporter (DMT)-like permease|uniref:DMT family transporter n=1 Tax=Sneathiella sedimenti TaxID=2816034 RepID=A0ABS3F1U5_9PROT|nr:DMT family transporter [Sneathiella sedimenti]MBO0332096.1 DMT family transporter [Sneathiella sedimenti]